MDFGKKKYLSFSQNVKAFTLVELLVSITMTGLILISLLFFLSGVVTQITELKIKNQLFNSFSSLRGSLVDMRAKYPQSLIAYDHTGTTNGMDVVLLYRQNPDLSYRGILFGIADTESLTGSLHFVKPELSGIYTRKQFVLHTLSSSGVASFLTGSSTQHRDILFGISPDDGLDLTGSLILPDIYPLSFQAVSYMSGAFVEARMSLLGTYFSTRHTDPVSQIDLDSLDIFLSF